MRGRQMRMHRLHHRLVIVRPGHRQYVWMGGPDLVCSHAETAGNDHTPVAVQGLADGVQRFGHRGIDEAAGIDDHQVGTFVAR